MKQLAILGPTASGKSALALQLAHQLNANILSLDSLSIYKYIDIASAKPSLHDRQSVHHFGIDILEPNEYFSVELFGKIYQKASMVSYTENKPLIIVGGSSFYLKALLAGISSLPTFSQETLSQTKSLLYNRDQAYQLLQSIDFDFSSKIDPHDTYRIEKGLLIYLETQTKPSLYFKNNPPQPIIKDLPIFAIDINRTLLKKRVLLRTQQMFQDGLIDEVCNLEHKYTRLPNPMKSIGIKEVLDYLDGKTNYQETFELITTHTMQLAKRQQTFNASQFDQIAFLPKELIYQEALKYLG